MDNIKNPAKKPKLKKSYSNSTIFQKLMVDDVRNKILFTILCLLIYRLGCGITIPFVNTAALQTMFGSTSVLDYYNLVSGGALSQCAVFAIGVSAYINASIIIQLLTVAIPKLEEISKDIGGQKQINKITQYVGCGLAAVTAIGYFFIMKNYGAMKYTSGISQVVEAITVIAILTAGSQIVIWLGWLIDEKGIGNGISLIIFTGIISRWDAVISLFQNSIAMGKENGWWYYLMIPGVILFVLAATFYVVFASDAERRVPVQYAGKNVGNKASTGQSSYIPIKLIMSGVMPIIFSSTICSMPSLVTMFLDYNKHPSLYMALASWNSRNWIYDVAYRVFVDFDADEVLGISPYWRADVMKGKFKNASTPQERHDYVIYQMHEDILQSRYDDSARMILDEIKKILPAVELVGQWSIHISEVWCLNPAHLCS